jgi:precorrin-3B C17-methyltransferase
MNTAPAAPAMSECPAAPALGVQPAAPAGSGRLDIVGLGPGAADLLAPRAAAVLDAAEVLVGYATYLARIPARDGQVRHASDNRQELARARQALELAAAGRRVAVVSSGDAGVFAMAAAVFEAIEAGPPAWRALEVQVVPGISAVLAAAARIGAPLGHDFCAVSLSDNLKPWAVVATRLAAAAQAGFVIALYNPASRARPSQLGAAFALLRGILPPATPVAFASAISRPEESVALTTLAAADPGLADMRTLVLIGSAATRRIERADGGAWLYTPRSAA